MIMIKRILLSGILGLTPLFSSVYALEISYSSTQEHLQELKDWKSASFSKGSSAEDALNNLRKSTYYAQALAELYEKQLNDNALQPYSLNLIKGYFDVAIKVNASIQSRDNDLEGILLKTLSMESLKKTNDLFFHPNQLRALMRDQFTSHPQLKQAWENLLRYNEKAAPQIENVLKKNNKDIKHLSDSLQSAWETSLSKRLIEQGKKLKSLTDTELTWRRLSDSVSIGFGNITTGASSAFGAVAGNISWREGYLKDNQHLLNKLKSTLLPFDLLMEKKAFKFTDKTIPGHWGHVGVYLGTREQLIELELWDHPSLLPFKEHIKKGKSIFQVRRWGLEFDSLEGFINLDEMAVLRVDNFTQKKRENLAQAYKLLSDQIDKSYDFSFDAMTGETVTCTEIIAFSFGPIAWPMEKLLGRLTISPNNLAELAFYTNTPLKTIFYATGNKDGLTYHSKDEFAKTLGYYRSGNVYQKHGLKCKREHYRHRRSALRFRYSCEDTFIEKTYQQD